MEEEEEEQQQQHEQHPEEQQEHSQQQQHQRQAQHHHQQASAMTKPNGAVPFLRRHPPVKYKYTTVWRCELHMRVSFRPMIFDLKSTVGNP